MLNVIDYVPGTTMLHRLNPVTKLALAASIIIATILADGYAALIALLLVTLLLGVALPLVLMLMVTKTTDLANACVEKLHIPYKYAFTFTTALRFVPVFTQEMNAIMEAQTARGVEFDSKNPFRKLSLMLPVCIPLLVTSVGKTDATALAAEQRGFYLRTRTSSYRRYPFAVRDAICGVLCAALIIAGAIL